METRYYLPDYLGGRRLELRRWFLENFTVEHLYSSYWKNVAPWDVPPRRLMDNFLLFPALPITVGVDGEEKVIDAGEFFFVPTGYRHWFSMPPGREYCEHIIVHCHFHSARLPNPAEAFASTIHRLDRYDEWYDRLQQMICLTSHSARATNAFIQPLLTELMLELLDCEGDRVKLPEIDADPRIEKTLLYLESHFASDLTVTDLAELAGLGEVQFRKLFRRRTGRSPKQYLERLRLSRASELLRTTERRVTDIALASGFNNAFYFCSSFKRETGMTPSQFRAHR